MVFQRAVKITGASSHSIAFLNISKLLVICRQFLDECLRVFATFASCCLGNPDSLAKVFQTLFRVRE